eukprot:8375670-Pyramimonas_sp.AAC.1
MCIRDRSSFVATAHGFVRTAPNIEGTCSQKKSPDTMLDYIVMSESAVPFVRDVAAVEDVPWKPHCALVVSLRSSALQLMTRVPELPAKLPQCPRPRAESKEGSKSQRQKANLQIARAEALARRRDKFRALFGDVLEDRSSQPHPPSEGLVAPAFPEAPDPDE